MAARALLHLIEPLKGEPPWRKTDLHSYLASTSHDFQPFCHHLTKDGQGRIQERMGGGGRSWVMETILHLEGTQ